MSENFVPVTVDQKVLMRDRSKNTDEIETVRKLSGGKGGYLGVYAATPDGAALGMVYTLPNEGKAEHMLKMLREALAKTDPVTPRKATASQINPDRGVGLRPDGSVRLALSVRNIEGGKPFGSPVFASIYLTAAEWAVLVPKEGKPGERYQLPEAVARQFAEAISGQSNLEYLIRAQDATSATLAAEVLPAQADGALLVRLVGDVAGTRAYLNDAKQPMGGKTSIEGILTLDATKKPRKLLMLFDGTFKPPWGSEKPVGGVVDWQAAAP